MFNISDNSCWQRSYTWHTNILSLPHAVLNLWSSILDPCFKDPVEKIQYKSMKSSQHNILQYNTYPFLQIIVEFLLVDTVVIVVEF